MANIGPAASRAENEATTLIPSNITNIQLPSTNVTVTGGGLGGQDGEGSSEGQAASHQLESEGTVLSEDLSPVAKNSGPPPQAPKEQADGEGFVSQPTPYNKLARAPRTPVRTALLPTPSIALPALPTSTPIFGHTRIIIENLYHTFHTHECDKIFNCPLIPPGTPNESRDTATRNHRSRHTIAKNWGIQLETLLRRAEDKMQLPPKYAKHLLSNLALLSNRVQDPNVALDLLARAYLEHRTPGDTSMLRVQDVKNTLEALDRASGRGTETRSGAGTVPINTQSEATPAPIAPPTVRSRAPRSTQVDTPNKNPMPPPPTPPAKSKRPQPKNPPRQTRLEKDTPSVSPSPEMGQQESTTPPVPSHSRNTRAAGTRGDDDSRAPNTYFLPADPEPPRKKRAVRAFKAKPIGASVALLATAPAGITGTVGGVRMWNGKRIFDSDIVDVAADYYSWQTTQYDETECRRQIEKRREEEAERELQRQARASESVEQEDLGNTAATLEPAKADEVDKDGDVYMNGTTKVTVATGPSTTILMGKNITDVNTTSPVLPPEAVSGPSVPESESDFTDDSPSTDAATGSCDADDDVPALSTAIVATTEIEQLEELGSGSVPNTPTASTNTCKESLATATIPVNSPPEPTRGPLASVLSFMGFTSSQQEPVAQIQKGESMTATGQSALLS